MKKDIIIENKLNLLAKEMNLDEEIIQDAFVALRENKRKSFHKPLKPWWNRFAPVAYAVVIIIIISLSINFIGNINNNDTIIPSPSPSSSPSPNSNATYSYNQIFMSNTPIQMSYNSITELVQIDPLIFREPIKLNYDDIDVKYYIMMDNNVPQFIISRNRVVGEDGADEVIIIIDLWDKLSDIDYRYNYNYNNEVLINYEEVRYNGEYYTYASIEYDDNIYYMMITSPNSGKLNQFIENIFNGSVQN